MTMDKPSYRGPKLTLKPKRHRCTIPGCGKAFTRLSHLQRHSLNHSDTQWVCNRCNAPFKRLDLLERHKARHLVKDRLAGGSGLGVLQTRRKTFPAAPDATGLSIGSAAEAERAPRNRPPGGSGVGASHTRSKSLSDASAVSNAASSSTGLIVEVEGTQPLPQPEGCQVSMNPTSKPNHMLVDKDAELNIARGEPQQLNVALPNNMAGLSMPLLDASGMVGLLSPSTNLCELGNMYYDTTFDSVHFDVMGFNRLSPDFSPATPSMSQSIDGGRSCDNDGQDLQHALPFRCSPRALSWAEINSQNLARRIDGPETNPSPALQRSMNVMSPLNISRVLPPQTRDSRGRLETPIHDVVQQMTDGDSVAFTDRRLQPPPRELQLTSNKRGEIIDLLTDIRPVYPDGSLVDGNTMSLPNMQEYLDLFFSCFNTSYPMIHVATLDIRTAEPIFLLSMIILGATYKNKGSHQLSVCLYDAVVPYILSGLMSIPLPDLSTLQAFLILECYGMYRAGPYQRENAMLIHTLLFSAIRRVSRYHVRGGIMLPNLLTHPENGWRNFAYAEQYKRLILFVFMWDTQNVSCYSFMPSMSTQTIQVRLPCSKELWEARTESEWIHLFQTQEEEPPFFNDMVKYLVEDGDKLQSRPLDGLSLTLVLHGLMSMCNDMVHFDNRSIYLGDLEKGEVSWTPWRRRMTHALETWKAKYDAYTMASVQSMDATAVSVAGGDEDLSHAQANYQKESIALLALYHTAHIVINCEIRHLQAAAGAKAIFGHIVTPADRDASILWVRQWITVHSSAADHAAWHAAQMFREGLLYLTNWDVNGIFHYPWCLVIGTLTCWTFHRFASDEISCSHPSGTEMSQGHSRALMNHLVSLMASVAPTDIRRTLTKCCTHGLSIEVARYLKSVRWTAAYEAMKLLEGLSK